MINLSFESVAELRRWLEKKNYESGSCEAFNNWLNEFFESESMIEGK